MSKPSRPPSKADPEPPLHADEGPYLTHSLRHFGRLTLIPPENDGRQRKTSTERRNIIGRAGQTTPSVPDAPDLIRSISSDTARPPPHAVKTHPSGSERATVSLTRPCGSSNMSMTSEEAPAYETDFLQNHYVNELARSSDVPAAEGLSETIAAASYETGPVRSTHDDVQDPISRQNMEVLHASSSTNVAVPSPNFNQSEGDVSPLSTSESIRAQLMQALDNAQRARWQADIDAGIPLHERIRRDDERRKLAQELLSLYQVPGDVGSESEAAPAINAHTSNQPLDDRTQSPRALIALDPDPDSADPATLPDNDVTSKSHFAHDSAVFGTSEYTSESPPSQSNESMPVLAGSPIRRYVAAMESVYALESTEERRPLPTPPIQSNYPHPETQERSPVTVISSNYINSPRVTLTTSRNTIEPIHSIMNLPESSNSAMNLAAHLQEQPPSALTRSNSESNIDAAPNFATSIQPVVHTHEPDQPGQDATTSPQSLVDFEITELDLLAARLMDNDSGNVSYDTLSHIVDFVGNERTAIDISKFAVGPVTVARRRVTPQGKVKIKLKCVDVSVDRCVACLSQFKAGDAAALMHCHHALHALCLREWFIRQQRTTCPSCRMDQRTWAYPRSPFAC